MTNTCAFNCRLCASGDLQRWMSDGPNRNLHYYRCKNCRLWNYDLRLGLDQTQYTAKYTSPASMTLNKHHGSVQTWNYLSRMFPSPARILDIGCGNASMLYLARLDGWAVEGMELSESAAKAIEQDQGIKVTVANFLEYTHGTREIFDLVCLQHVLEHLPDPHLAMQKIDCLVKPGGYAYFEFPNTASAAYLVKRFLKNLGLKNKKYSEQWRPGHCNEYCRTAFIYLLDTTSFELIDWQTYSSKDWMNRIYQHLPIGSKARALIRKA